MSHSESIKAFLSRVQLIALVVGLVGLGLGVVGAALDPRQFFQSYLIGYAFWTQLGLGCLGILLIHHVAGGGWGTIAQRVLEAGAKNLLLMALLFIPIIIGLQRIYEWAVPEIVAEDAIIQFKQPYLNAPFFVGRTVLYFAIWLGLTFVLSRIAATYDKSGDEKLRARMKAVAAPGIIFFFLSATFASFDWMMSLEPHWFSTAYGAIFTVGGGVAAFAFVILVMNALAKHEPFAAVVTKLHFSDWGNFLMATIMLWTYLSFSQYLIIWSGNLAEETPWYINRTSHGWEYIAYGLIGLHFVFPFLALIPRTIKRNARLLSVVALIVFVISRPLELIFLINPAFHPGGLFVHWLDIVLLVGIGGIWLALFAWQLRRVPALYPVHDPRLKTSHEEMAYGQHATSHA